MDRWRCKILASSCSLDTGFLYIECHPIIGTLPKSSMRDFVQLVSSVGQNSSGGSMQFELKSLCVALPKVQY